jgi:Lar family restriction alleviation protein
MDTDKMIELKRIKQNLSYLWEQMEHLTFDVNKLEQEGSRLKPCPFCGAAAKESFSMNIYSVYCPTCSAHVQSMLTAEQARSRWNTRE